MGVLRAKLTFDDGLAERPIDRIVAFSTEKTKGMQMLERIEDRFGISQQDRESFFQDKLKEFKAMPIAEETKEVSSIVNKLTRDERGNLASPFRSKKRI